MGRRRRGRVTKAVRKARASKRRAARVAALLRMLERQQAAYQEHATHAIPVLTCDLCVATFAHALARRVFEPPPTSET